MPRPNPAIPCGPWLVSVIVAGVAHRLEPAANAQPWADDAACKEHPELDWVPDRGTPLDDHRVVCAGCAVSAECLAWALEHNETFGVWGGTSSRERRKLRREYLEREDGAA